MEFSKEDCQKWLNNKFFNPKSNHRIRFAGPTYRSLITHCKHYELIPDTSEKQDQFNQLVERFDLLKDLNKILINNEDYLDIKLNWANYEIDLPENKSRWVNHRKLLSILETEMIPTMKKQEVIDDEYLYSARRVLRQAFRYYFVWLKNVTKIYGRKDKNLKEYQQKMKMYKFQKQ